ncbi:hypothetical protein BP5796_01985 [Coleophoma crateriformis]|uniref:Uncharacterized protein n=1 Tax=Coleophoma crateriformis TaxID=565419 RepID=A0A3D8T2D5_9HELO|nr:hypothetical protein BP5796_01985 [Coleophoma crateriformis]
MTHKSDETWAEIKTLPRTEMSPSDEITENTPEVGAEMGHSGLAMCMYLDCSYERSVEKEKASDNILK